MPVLDNFKVQSQGAAGNLCWLCVGLSIASHYDRLAGVSLRWSKLCEYLGAVLASSGQGRTDCCSGQRLLDPDCNQPGFVPDALHVSQNRGEIRSDPLTFKEVQTEINGKRPVGVDIETLVGSHAVVIYGYDLENGQRVMVGDPAPDAPDGLLIPYDELCMDYRHAGGKWKQSYLTVAMET
jgi:hypothetical protein